MTVWSRHAQAQSIVKVEPVREHRQRSVWGAPPVFPGTVPIELDAVVVGIAQVQRFADAVIAGAVERNSSLDHAMQCVGERWAGRIEDGGVKQSGRSRRRRMAAFAFPG